MKRRKQKLKNRRYSKTVVRWALSYLPAVLLPLILGSLMYGYSMRAVQEKAETIQYTMLEDRSETLQEIFDKIGSLTVQIQGNQTVNRLSQAAQWTAAERYLLQDAQKLLSEYMINHEEIREIFLYFPQEDCILGKSAAFSAESAKMLQAKMGMSQDEFFRLLSGELYGTFHVAKEQLLYTSVYRKNLYFSRQPMIAIVYLSDTFMDYLLHTSEVEFFLTDQEGNRYQSRSYDEAAFGLAPQEAMALSFETGPMQWIGTTCVYQDVMERYPLVLYSVQPDVAYLSSMRRMQLLLAAYFVLCLLAGVFLIWFQAGRNYKPVDEMLMLIKRHGYLGGRELPDARQSLARLIEAYEERKSVQDRQERVIVSHALYQLFVPDKAEMKASYQMICQLLSGEVRQVAQLCVPEEEETGLEVSLQLFMFQNVLAEVLEGKVPFILGEMGGNFYLLAGERKEGGEPLRRDELEAVSAFFKEKCGLDAAIGLSGVRTGWEGAQIAYDELLALAGYRGFLTGHPKVLVYEELSEEPLLQEFYRMFRLERQMRLELSEHQLEALEKNLQRYKKYLETDSMRSWRGEEAEGGEAEEKLRLVADEVQQYIEENYADKQLTVGALADRYQVSAPWLSRSFKKEKGCGVLEYIGQVRMEHAKELLASGLTVTETSDRVGYYSSRPLIRLFTEKVGMTPAKYKESQKKEG